MLVMMMVPKILMGRIRPGNGKASYVFAKDLSLQYWPFTALFCFVLFLKENSLWPMLPNPSIKT